MDTSKGVDIIEVDTTIRDRRVTVVVNPIVSVSPTINSFDPSNPLSKPT